MKYSIGCTPSGGGRHMEDPNNPGAVTNDPMVGLWFHTNTAIAGAALNGIVARRGGCYVAPPSRAAGLIHLVGRSAFFDRLRMAQGNPATDLNWGVEPAKQPPANVDWRSLLHELRRKYEWVGSTVERLNKQNAIAAHPSSSPT
jgi:hypothetical protein